MSTANRQTDMVAKALGLEILSGQRVCGEKLPSDAQLCADYAVSRTVIREALRLLGGKGLLVARPRVGTLVAESDRWALWDGDILAWLAEGEVDENVLADGRDMRLAIEPMLAALAASRADDAANLALQNALRDLQADMSQAAELAFLRCFYMATGNRFAAAALHLAVFCVQQRAHPIPLDAYRTLTAAIAQNDAAQARQAAYQILLEH